VIIKLWYGISVHLCVMQFVFLLFMNSIWTGMSHHVWWQGEFWNWSNNSGKSASSAVSKLKRSDESKYKSNNISWIATITHFGKAQVNYTACGVLAIWKNLVCCFWKTKWILILTLCVICCECLTLLLDETKHNAKCQNVYLRCNVKTMNKSQIVIKVAAMMFSRSKTRP